MSQGYKIATIFHGNQSKSIAIYPGIEISELIEVIQSVFHCSENILALQSNVCYY